MSIELAIGQLMYEARKCLKDKYRHRLKLCIYACDVKNLYEKEYGSDGTMTVDEIKSVALEKAVNDESYKKQ